MNTKIKLSSKQYFAIAAAILISAAITINVFFNMAAGKTPTNDSAWLVFLLCLLAGDLAAVSTNDFVPGMFISIVLAVIGFWTVVPKEIRDFANIPGELCSLMVMVMIINMGAMLNLKELIAQWKTIVIVVASMVGICIAVMGVGSLFMDFKTTAIAAPPLTGGLVAMLMMQETANEMGNTYLATLAVAVYALQGFIGCPVTTICLKQEARRVLKLYRKGKININDIISKEETTTPTEKLIPPLPEKYQGTNLTLFKMFLLIILSGQIEAMTNGLVSKYIIGLVLGVIATEIGFLEPRPLEKTKSMGIVLLLIMMNVMSSMSGVTLELLKTMVIDFIILIVLTVIGIAIFSLPVGHKLGWSIPMSFAVGISSLVGGFPGSYVLSVEAARILSDTEEEYQLLEQHFVPKTLVAGFASATVGSVIIASLVVAMFF